MGTIRFIKWTKGWRVLVHDFYKFEKYSNPSKYDDMKLAHQQLVDEYGGIDNVIIKCRKKQGEWGPEGWYLKIWGNVRYTKG